MDGCQRSARGGSCDSGATNPDFFVNTVRPLSQRGPFAELVLKRNNTMMGRTYALGHEPNLEEWLMDRSRRAVTEPEWPWAVWYPFAARRVNRSPRGNKRLFCASTEPSAMHRHGGLCARTFGCVVWNRQAR